MRRTRYRAGVVVAVLMFAEAAAAFGTECGPPPSDASNTGKPQTVRIAGVVLMWLRMGKEGNYRRGAELIREAAEGGARIVVTSEGFLDGFMNGDRTIPLSLYQSLAERIPGGDYYQRFIHLARPILFS